MTRFPVRFVILLGILLPVCLQAADPALDPLFHIERNKNANIVQYDAQLGSNGLLLKKEPVVAYWVRHANQGEIRELTWIQRTFAYGFDVKLNKNLETATLDLAADLGRTIEVVRDKDDYRAVVRIKGEESYLEKIFIHATGSGMSTKVDYIELFGTGVSEEGEQYERFSP